MPQRVGHHGSADAEADPDEYRHLFKSPHSERAVAETAAIAHDRQLVSQCDLVGAAPFAFRRAAARPRPPHVAARHPSARARPRPHLPRPPALRMHRPVHAARQCNVERVRTNDV